MDLALTGNGSFQALVDTCARLQWLCWPRFDSSFVFGALLDEDKGGSFAINYVGKHEARQQYRRNTAIIETRLEGSDGEVEIVDFAPRDRDGNRPLRFVRRVRALRGRPTIRLSFRAVYEYGREELQAGGPLHFQSCDASGREVACDHEIELASDLYLVLSWKQPVEGALAAYVESALEETATYWTGWVSGLSLPSEFADEVVRSAITLKLHQFDDSGALTAATTTSIPEHPGSGRNWDYRFCWPRDGYFTADALRELGSIEEASRFADFLLMLGESGAPFQPLYGVGGERDIEEEELPHLAGYHGEKPVRIGNQAYVQDQHDIYGEMIASLLLVETRRESELRAMLWRLLETIELHFESPDAGLWEKRNTPDVHTFSLLMHWLGGKKCGEYGRKLGDRALAERGQSIMERAAHFIHERCWLEQEGFYADTVDGDKADAALLFMINIGFLSAEDPRAARHLVALRDRLQTEHGLFHRYLHDDGLGLTHSSFTVCTLWYAEALACLGEFGEAEEVLRSVLVRGNHVGLLSEDIDPRDGTLWGNFPQTYSHVGIIRCALALSRRR